MLLELDTGEQIEIHKKVFSDGELYVRVGKNLLNKRVILLHRVDEPNVGLMDLFLELDAIKRSGAKEIHLIVPYLPYSRQDRVVLRGEAISAKVIASIISKYVSAVHVFSIHSEQICGFFDVPCYNWEPYSIFVPKLPKEFGVLSPDVGGVNRCKKFASFFDAPVSFLVKNRDPKTGEIEVGPIIGDLMEKMVIYDDLIASGGTMVKAISALKEEGVKEIYVCATHGLFTKKGAFEGLFFKGFVSDSILRDVPPQFEVLSLEGEIQKIIDFLRQ